MALHRTYGPGTRENLLRRVLQGLAFALVPALGLSGCAQLHRPDNHALALFDPEKSAKPILSRDIEHPARPHNQLRCASAGTTHYIATVPKPRSRETVQALTMRYSSGDRFNVQVPGSAEYNGDYIINLDGRVILPFAGEIRAIGLTNSELTTAIERALIKAKLFQPDQFKIAVRPVLYAPINITIAGAVFLAGRFTISNRDGDKGDKALAKYGDSPLDRNVAAALRAGGGVRPDADLSNIKLIRDGKTMKLDWQGALIGSPVDDVPLIDGDHIEVSESGCFQSALVRPSQITPPGIRVFMSNLTVPAQSNAGSAITKESFNLPYGARLLQGLVSANCVGGSLASNAARHGVLISRNPKTHRTEVIQRSVEQLILSPDRDEINPFLMPDDAIACYDSAVTDVREISSLINQLILPRATWRAN
jgi:polysaccharide biosynthesis/export protein